MSLTLTMLQQYGIDPVYGLDNGYGYDDDSRHSSQLNSTTGSTALYHHNGTRYGLSMAARNSASPSGEAKMNGLHGPKHKRGDMERECMSLPFLFVSLHC